MSACEDCKHEHAGPEFAGICIGCPCETIPPAAFGCARCGRHPKSSRSNEHLTRGGWLHFASETLGGEPIDVWVCPLCRPYCTARGFSDEDLNFADPDDIPEEW